MPLAPDHPFPKTQGNTIRSKDWNDTVTEIIRLDGAKLNRAGADRLAGPLSVDTKAGRRPGRDRARHDAARRRRQLEPLRAPKATSRSATEQPLQDRRGDGRRRHGRRPSHGARRHQPA